MFISVDLPAPFSPSSACTSPRADVEVDVVVGDDARELLADPAHLEDELVGHCGAILNRKRKGRARGPPFHELPPRFDAYPSAVGTLSVPAMIFAL